MEEDDFLAGIVQKIDAGEELSESEVREIIDCYSDWNYTEEGRDRRWHTSMMSYFAFGSRWFAQPWEKGKTEMQESEFYAQPYEVVLTRKEMVIPEYTAVLTSWEPKVKA